jgi:hypothetical protein
MAALGIARTDDADMRAKADADLVVASLDDVDVERLGGRSLGHEDWIERSPPRAKGLASAPRHQLPRCLVVSDQCVSHTLTGTVEPGRDRGFAHP